MHRRQIAFRVVVLTALWAGPAGAAIEPFTFGVDLDDFATPGGTEVGFESVIPCTPFAAPLNPTCASIAPDPNPGPLHAGYIDDGTVLTEQRFDPVDADLPELWRDAHRATEGGRTLRIGNLEPGPYRVIMLGHNPAGGTAESTIFEVNGQLAGQVFNAPGARLEVGVSQSVVFDVDVVDGLIDIHFRAAPGSGAGGWMNGAVITLIPEPSSRVLGATGLLLFVGLRRGLRGRAS